jgi:predicted nucleic acid-binding protein
MSLLVDTSVWSLAFRRDAELNEPEVIALRAALLGGEQVFTTGLVLQELLQGVVGSKAKDLLLERFAALGFLQPDRGDHVEAAEVRNACRRKGVQLGTIDALLVQLARRHGLILLSTDQDFRSASAHVEFGLWAATSS